VRPGSDLDILIWYDQIPNGWGFIGAKLQLEDELGVPVDLVTDRGLSPYLRDSIINSARTYLCWMKKRTTSCISTIYIAMQQISEAGSATLVLIGRL